MSHHRKSNYEILAICDFWVLFRVVLWWFQNVHPRIQTVLLYQYPRKFSVGIHRFETPSSICSLFHEALTNKLVLVILKASSVCILTYTILDFPNLSSCRKNKRQISEEVLYIHENIGMKQKNSIVPSSHFFILCLFVFTWDSGMIGTHIRYIYVKPLVCFSSRTFFFFLLYFKNQF